MEDELHSEDENGEEDDEDDVHDIDHTTIPKETVCVHRPTSELERRVMDEECTPFCIYPISDDEVVGSKRYCNAPIKLFRNDKNKSGCWNTSTWFLYLLINQSFPEEAYRFLHGPQEEKRIGPIGRVSIPSDA